MTLTLTPRDPRIHVFSVSDGPMRLAHQTYLSRLGQTAERDGGATPLAHALGAEIDPTYAEVFAIADIAPMSLRDYLAQAHDIPEAALAADAARLDALSGDVVVLAPRAVEGAGAMQPDPQLTQIGSYTPAAPETRAPDLPPATPPEPRIATPAATADAGPASRTILWTVLAALVVAVGLMLLL